MTLIVGMDSVGIDFAPASLQAEVLQNVRIILGTVKGTVPLHRGFGVDSAMVDKPMPEALEMISADIIDAIRRYEPRAEVVQVSWENDAVNGVLRPVVQVNING